MKIEKEDKQEYWIWDDENWFANGHGKTEIEAINDYIKNIKKQICKKMSELNYLNNLLSEAESERVHYID